MEHGDLVREWLDDLPDVVPDARPDALNPLSFDELLAKNNGNTTLSRVAMLRLQHARLPPIL